MHLSVSTEAVNDSPPANCIVRVVCFLASSPANHHCFFFCNIFLSSTTNSRAGTFACEEQERSRSASNTVWHSEGGSVFPFGVWIRDCPERVSVVRKGFRRVYALRFSDALRLVGGYSLFLFNWFRPPLVFGLVPGRVAEKHFMHQTSLVASHSMCCKPRLFKLPSVQHPGTAVDDWPLQRLKLCSKVRG